MLWFFFSSLAIAISLPVKEDLVPLSINSYPGHSGQQDIRDSHLCQYLHLNNIFKAEVISIVVSL